MLPRYTSKTTSPGLECDGTPPVLAGISNRTGGQVSKFASLWVPIDATGAANLHFAFLIENKL